MAQKSDNLILEALLQAKESGELIEINDDPQDPDTFLSVKVLLVEAEAVLLSIYLSSGIWGGLQINKITNIHRVWMDGEELRKKKAVIKLIAQGALGDWGRKRIMGLADLPKFEGLDMVSVLQTIAKARQFCCPDLVSVEAESIYGYIEQVEDDYFSISTYSGLGENEGVNTFRINDIQRISFYITQCEIRERLAMARKTLG